MTTATSTRTLSFDELLTFSDAALDRLHGPTPHDEAHVRAAVAAVREYRQLPGPETRAQLYQSRRARWSPMAMPVAGMIAAPMIGERVKPAALVVTYSFGVALVTTLGIRQALLAPEVWRLRAHSRLRRRMYRPVTVVTVSGR